jgi:hypothetical protein
MERFARVESRANGPSMSCTTICHTTEGRERTLEKHGPPSGGDEPCIFTSYITVRGRRIYHPTGGVFRIPLSRLKKK